MDRRVVDVQIGSLSERYGIKQGDIILQLNGKKEFDIIDYMLASADENISIVLKNDNGTERKIIMENDFSLPVGLSFEQTTIDKPHRCTNNCIFCFMEQMPSGLRESLYFKDDDYRLSFLSGNYITLTNVSDEDIKRIIELKMSPLNISVHTTNPALRCQMMNNKNAGNIMSRLKTLCEGGIDFNLQFVLCPGYNDKDELESSLKDVMSLLPSVKSLSCVPVGLTKYRNGLTHLNSFTREEAKSVIDTVDKYANEVKKKYPEICFCASDEFFILAQEGIRNASYYMDYIQYENGVGMMRSFIDDCSDSLSESSSKNNMSATLVTGELAYNILNEEIAVINEHFGSNMQLIAVKNDFFAGKVSAAGLVCGSDIISQLKGKKLSDILFVPSNMLKDDEDIFLDDVKLCELEENLHVKAYRVPSEGYDFCEYVKEFV